MAKINNPVKGAGGRRTKGYLEIVDKEILKLVCQGKTHTTILDYLMLKGFKIDNAKFRLKCVLEKLRDDNKNECDVMINEYKTMYLKLFEDATNVGNTKIARDILDSLVKLDGLLIERKDIKLSNTFTIDFD